MAGFSSMGHYLPIKITVVNYKAFSSGCLNGLPQQLGKLGQQMKMRRKKNGCARHPFF